MSEMHDSSSSTLAQGQSARVQMPTLLKTDQEQEGKDAVQVFQVQLRHLQVRESGFSKHLEWISVRYKLLLGITRAYIP